MPPEACCSTRLVRQPSPSSHPLSHLVSPGGQSPSGAGGAPHRRCAHALSCSWCGALARRAPGRCSERRFGLNAGPTQPKVEKHLQRSAAGLQHDHSRRQLQPAAACQAGTSGVSCEWSSATRSKAQRSTKQHAAGPPGCVGFGPGAPARTPSGCRRCRHCCRCLAWPRVQRQPDSSALPPPPAHGLLSLRALLLCRACPLPHHLLQGWVCLKRLRALLAAARPLPRC